MKWTKKGFEEFREGSFGNGGQNLYVSVGGTLQRIFNFEESEDFIKYLEYRKEKLEIIKEKKN